MGDLEVGGGSGAAALAATKGSKEPAARDRINDITKELLSSQELKDFQAALKEHGASFVVFGEPPREYKVPFSDKSRKDFATSLATVLDKQSVNPAKDNQHDPELAKDYAKSFLNIQTEGLKGQDVFDPKEVIFKWTIQTPDYSPKTMDFSGD